MFRSVKAQLWLLSMAAIFAACQSSPPSQQTSQTPQPLRLESPETPAAETPAPAPAPEPPPPSKAPASKPPASAKPAPAAKVRAVERPAEIKPEPIPSVEPRHVEQQINASRQEQDDDVIVTTISGCLEKNKSKFRLTDMVGEHAPKSRSWKTGFFRKGSAKLDLIAESSGLKFDPHVGYRVDVTGSLAKKVMHAHSLIPTSAKCS